MWRGNWGKNDTTDVPSIRMRISRMQRMQEGSGDSGGRLEGNRRWANDGGGGEQQEGTRSDATVRRKDKEGEGAGNSSQCHGNDADSAPGRI
eukprot:3967920-Karenia_brevis.AAC.1